MSDLTDLFDLASPDDDKKYTVSELLESWEEVFISEKPITEHKIIQHIKDGSLRAERGESGKYLVSEKEKIRFEKLCMPKANIRTSDGKVTKNSNKPVFPLNRIKFLRSARKNSAYYRVRYTELDILNLQMESSMAYKMMETVSKAQSLLDLYEPLKYSINHDVVHQSARNKAMEDVNKRANLVSDSLAEVNRQSKLASGTDLLGADPWSEMMENERKGRELYELGRVQKDATGMASVDLYSGIAGAKKDAMSAALIGLAPKSTIDEMGAYRQQMEEAAAGISLAERMGLLNQPSVVEQIAQAEAVRFGGIAEELAFSNDLVAGLHSKSLLVDPFQDVYLSAFKQLNQFDITAYDPRFEQFIARREQERRHQERCERANNRADKPLEIKLIVCLIFQEFERQRERMILAKRMIRAIDDDELDVFRWPNLHFSQDHSHFGLVI